MFFKMATEIQYGGIGQESFKNDSVIKMRPMV